MHRQLILTYNKEFIKKANKHFWLRSYTLKTVIGDSLVASLFAYKWIKGDSSWLIGFLGMCVLVVLTIRFVTYFIPLKQGLSRFEQMQSKDVLLTLTDETFSAKSDLGLWEVPWRIIKKVWKFPELWLLFPAESGHFSLPISMLDSEAQKFIISQVQKNGGEVT